MDEILGTLIGKLCDAIKNCQERNPSLDMHDVSQACILIQSYIDGLNKPVDKEDPEPLPDMSYEQVCKLTRPPRITPRGHLGPTSSMVRYAEEKDNSRARIVDTIIQYGKKLEKNTRPFF